MGLVRGSYSGVLMMIILLSAFSTGCLWFLSFKGLAPTAICFGNDCWAA